MLKVITTDGDDDQSSDPLLLCVLHSAVKCGRSGAHILLHLQS